jgi:hypothetical protein
MPYWVGQLPTVATAPQTFCPAIVESYRDFEPPPNFKQHVETLLRYVPPKYLIGLTTLVLTNRAGLTRDERKKKSGVETTRCAWLNLWVLIIALRSWNRTPVLCYLVVGQVLYHEIGHHIHAVHRLVYAEKEDVAENWSGKLTRRFYRQRFWYLYPFLYGVARLALLLRKST